MWWLVELEQGRLRRWEKFYGLFVDLSAKNSKEKKNIPGVDLVIKAHTLAKNVLYSQRNS